MVSKAKAPTLGALIDQLNALREKKRSAQKVLDEASKEFSDLEAKVVERLQEEGMDKGTGKTATASISKSIVANINDWDKVYAFIKKTGHFHLLHRRVSDAAFRELYDREFDRLSNKKGFDPDKFDKSTVIPGFVPFEKTSLNLRNLA